MSNYVIGIDVGGTNIKFGLVNRFGKITARTNLKTQQFSKDRAKLINALCGVVNDFLTKNKLKRKNIAGIGIGLPGLIDPIRGYVHVLPNIPNWEDVPLKRILEKKLKIKIFLDNDVNLITLAEWKFGAGKRVQNLVCITLGTGVGGGLILDNKLYRGEGFAAGEVGHMPLNEKGPVNHNGEIAIMESYVGNRQIVKKAQRVLKRKNLTIPLVRKLALSGNKKAIQVWTEAGEHIGNGLVGVVNLLNPKLVIVGGGVSHSHMLLFPTIRNILKKRCMKVQGKMVRITRAKLGSDAGIIGAQVLINNA